MHIFHVWFYITNDIRKADFFSKKKNRGEKRIPTSNTAEIGFDVEACVDKKENKNNLAVCPCYINPVCFHIPVPLNFYLSLKLLLRGIECQLGDCSLINIDETVRAGHGGIDCDCGGTRKRNHLANKIFRLAGWELGDLKSISLDFFGSNLSFAVHTSSSSLISLEASGVAEGLCLKG